jgi:surface polysaccharide O-acyltransferase-like enzyme
MLGYFLAKMIKQSGKKGKKLITFYLCLAIFVEVIMGLFFLNFHFRNWEVPAYLYSKEIAPHSIYTMQALDTPYYTWTHRHKYLNAEGKE